MRTIRLVNETRLAGSPVPATVQASAFFSTRTVLSAWCSSNAVTFESSKLKICRLLARPSAVAVGVGGRASGRC